jgi:hypothetical protein
MQPKQRMTTIASTVYVHYVGVRHHTEQAEDGHSQDSGGRHTGLDGSFPSDWLPSLLHDAYVLSVFVGVVIVCAMTMCT